MLTSLAARLQKIRERRKGLKAPVKMPVPELMERPFDDPLEPSSPPEGAHVTITKADSATELAVGTTGPSADSSVEAGEIQLASIVKIRKNKVLLQRLDPHGPVRVNAKFRVYRSILKNAPVGWVKIIRIEGKELQGRIIDGESRMKVGDYIDLQEKHTIDNYLDSFRK